MNNNDLRSKKPGSCQDLFVLVYSPNKGESWSYCSLFRVKLGAVDEKSRFIADADGCGLCVTVQQVRQKQVYWLLFTFEYHWIVEWSNKKWEHRAAVKFDAKRNSIYLLRRLLVILVQPIYSQIYELSGSTFYNVTIWVGDKHRPSSQKCLLFVLSVSVYHQTESFEVKPEVRKGM